MTANQPRSGERLARLTEKFAALYQAKAEMIVRAPGRVNLMGEHTDYNDGFVLPMAINLDLLIAVRPRQDRQVRVFSLNFANQVAFNLDSLDRELEPSWGRYMEGVAWALAQEGYTLKGFDAVIDSTVPVGSGLSSSAAIEVGSATAFDAVNGLGLDGKQRALIGHKGSNGFVGIPSGIMDQFISALGQKGKALLIDCRSFAYQAMPLITGTQIVVLDSSERRELVGSEYATRRAQCEEAVRILAQVLPAIQALRDVEPAEFHKYAHLLQGDVLKRARHVVGETARMSAAVEALRSGDADTFGRLMDETHASLRDDYEVSTPALDALTEIAHEVPGCYGARLTGAGFGGCTVNLVAEEAVSRFTAHIHDVYAQRTGLSPLVYLTSAEDGAGVMPITP